MKAPVPDSARTALKILYAEDVQVIFDTAKSVQVTKTCSALKGLGADIRLVCLRGRGTLEDAFRHYGIRHRFPVRRLPHIKIRYAGSLWYRLLFAGAILGSDADIIYTRDLGTAVVAGWLRRPFIYEMHSMPVRQQQRWMLRRIGGSPWLIAVTAITHRLARALAEQYRLAPEKIHVIPCSADPPETSGTATEKEPRRAFRAGYVGHLYEGKGGRLIAELARRHPDIEFHIVGEVAEKSLDDLLPANVIRHGIKSHVEAMALLTGFDCALAPYSLRTEAVDGKVISDWFSPLKIFEYMAHQVPVISSDLPVISEILTANETALMVEPGNSTAWAEALARLRDDVALRKRLTLNAIGLIEDRFSYTRRAEAILDVAVGGVHAVGSA